MAGPSWLSGTFAAVMLVIAGYCAARLVAAGARRRESELDADGVHLLMGVAMAGMLVPALGFGPSGAWIAVFAAAAGWFAWQAARVWRGLGAGRWCCPYPVPHLAESMAMVYMLAAVRTPAGAGAAMPGVPGMGGASGMARVPELAVVFALFMVGYVVWLGDRLTSVSPAAAPGAASAVASGAASGAAGGAASGAAGGAVPLAVVPAAPGMAQAAGIQPGGAASRLPGGRDSRPGAARQAGGCWPMLAPRAAACYKIAMGITMGYTLIIML